MKSKFRNRLIFTGFILLLLTSFAFWYRATYSMEEVATYQVNSQETSLKIAIATQGSPFKDTIVTHIINYYKKDSISITVLDVSDLATLSATEYNAIVILHTWEYGSPPKVVRDFIENHREQKERLIVLATSGQGTHKIAEVDALTGESILENAKDYSDKIIERIEKILQQKIEL